MNSLLFLKDIDYSSKKELLEKLRKMRDDLQSYPKGRTHCPILSVCKLFIQEWELNNYKKFFVNIGVIMENKKMLKVLVKEPYRQPYVKEIEDTLDDKQLIVGGLIECVGMPDVKHVDLYVNEEGKLDRLPGNFWLPEYEDCVVGTCFMIGYDENTGENISLTDK